MQLQRATFLYQARPAADDEVEAELATIAHANPRYGYRPAWALLRRKRTVNRKRVPAGAPIFWRLSVTRCLHAVAFVQQPRSQELEQL